MNQRNKDNVARTRDDWESGILNGKNVFNFPRPGKQQMTMNTPKGVVPFPLKYEGYTNGTKTDEGVANPGDDFEVEGDTVREVPDLNQMSFSNAFNYARENNLPVFTWRNKEYKNSSYGLIKKDGGIHINPANKGKFTASANNAGMGVQEFASHVLANKEDYSPMQRQRANFARNSTRFKHQIGGYADGAASYHSKSNDYPTLDAHTKSIIDGGHDYNYDWKTYFVPGSNADYPVGLLKQFGGYTQADNITNPNLRKPMFSQDGLASTDVQPVSLPLYQQGQRIKYMCGGQVKSGVVKSHDAKTGKIKLY